MGCSSGRLIRELAAKRAGKQSPYAQAFLADIDRQRELSEVACNCAFRTFAGDIEVSIGRSNEAGASAVTRAQRRRGPSGLDAPERDGLARGRDEEARTDDVFVSRLPRPIAFPRPRGPQRAGLGR